MLYAAELGKVTVSDDNLRNSQASHFSKLCEASIQLQSGRAISAHTGALLEGC